MNYYNYIDLLGSMFLEGQIIWKIPFLQDDLIGGCVRSLYIKHQSNGLETVKCSPETASGKHLTLYFVSSRFSSKLLTPKETPWTIILKGTKRFVSLQIAYWNSIIINLLAQPGRSLKMDAYGSFYPWFHPINSNFNIMTLSKIMIWSH